jgi:hypothetical protein
LLYVRLTVLLRTQNYWKINPNQVVHFLIFNF